MITRKAYLDSRIELERRVYLLVEAVKSGEMQLGPFPQTIKSLKKMRNAQNIRLLLFTVDSSVRSMMMMSAAMDTGLLKSQEDEKEK